MQKNLIKTEVWWICSYEKVRMLFVWLHFCLNERSLQHTKNAMRKMSDTYINSQPKPSCSVITLSTKLNLTWSSAVTQYDNMVTGQGYQKSHRNGKRQKAMVKWCFSRENRRYFEKNTNFSTANSSITDVTCHAGMNPVDVLTGQHLTPEIWCQNFISVSLYIFYFHALLLRCDG
jgi:hypothetical protein